MIPVYYINLDRSTDRLLNIQKQQTKVGQEFCRIPAVDGSKLTSQEKEENCSVFCKNFCTPSMIGCFMSHKKAWKTVADGRDDYAVIVEDDCVLKKSFIKDTGNLVLELNKKEPDWDFVYLGSISLGNVSIFTDIKTKLRFRSSSYHVPKQPLGFHCYLISKKGANKLLRVFSKVEYHVDLMFLLKNEHFRVFASNKKLGYQPSTSENSTLNETKFPKLINNAIDVSGIKQDDVSLSYHLSAPLIRLPFIDVNINTYVIIFAIFMMKKNFKKYILLYFLYEFLRAETLKDKKFIAFWAGILSFI